MSAAMIAFSERSQTTYCLLRTFPTAMCRQFQTQVGTPQTHFNLGKFARRSKWIAWLAHSGVQ